MYQLGFQIGHLHPLLVHLPIGIILFCFILEIYGRIKPNLNFNHVIEFTLLVAAATALLSLCTGWLLGEDGGYDEKLLFLHRWMAVAFTATTILLYLVKRSNQTWTTKLYLPLFIIVIGLVGITGHYGGNMTHGEDYLFVQEKKENVISNVNEAKLYEELVQPILESKCVSCHNTKKTKGGLLLDSPRNILAGGDSGSPLDTIQEGEPSLLMLRIHMPLVEKEHMPPKGKIQLTSNEKALLDWWIANQHCFDCQVKDVPKDEKMLALLQTFEQDTSTIAILGKEAENVSKEWIRKMQRNTISIQTLSEENNLLRVSLAYTDTIHPSILEELEEYADNIIEMDIGFTDFNDELMSYLTPFKNLIKLKLPHTKITDGIGKQINSFEHLESLNLYGTAVTDNILADIEKNQNLKQLYVWNTKVNEGAITELERNRPNLRVERIDESIFESSELEPPLILGATTFFKDSLLVEIESIFKDANLYYTLDGSTPSVENSIKYTAPFALKKTANIQAIALKEGWGASDIAKVTFIKNTIEYTNVYLNKAPHEKYSGIGGETLLDKKRGSVNFVDGNWLGYEGQSFSATFELKEPQKISAVAIGALSAPGSWIFYPTGFTISTSTNGKDYNTLIQKNLPSEQPNSEVKRTFFDLDFKPITAKFVKLEIISPLKNPSWHPNPGGKSWIFIDEIVLN